MLSIIQKEAIHHLFCDYTLLDLIKLTPFMMKGSIMLANEKKQREAIETHYLEIVVHEHAFLSEIKKNRKDYALLFDTYNYSYHFYCNALCRNGEVFVDKNYFTSLYKNKQKSIAFNPLKENLLFILNPKHEQVQIILS